MTRWQPDADLSRLLAALGYELLAASDEEVRQATRSGGRAVGTAAAEVREVIDGVIDPDDAIGAEAGLPPAERGREQRARQH